MKRAIKILTSLITIVLGWLLIGIGFTTKLGHPINTTLFLLGIGLFFIGSILFLKIAIFDKS
jgi:hypothetical protein